MCCVQVCCVNWNGIRVRLGLCECVRMVWCVCLYGSWLNLHSASMNDIGRLGRLLYSSPFSLWAALVVDPIELCYPKQLTLTAKSQRPQA